MSSYHITWVPINNRDSFFKVYHNREVIFEKYIHKYYCNNNICFTETSKPFLPTEFMNFLNNIREKKTTKYIIDNNDGEESFYYDAKQNHFIFYMNLYSSNMKFILPNVHRDELVDCLSEFYQHAICHE